MTEPGDDSPNKPFGNCYWVEAGRWLAGEYPAGRTAEETTGRLQRLLDVGIDTFIDLTAEGELPEYASALSALAPNSPPRYLRFAIPDHDVPATPAAMSATLNAIEAALAQGRHIYLHCRAGIGRTGTVVGCYLSRQAGSGDAALDALNTLWQGCERAHAWPCIPETPEQNNYVLEWRETVAQRLGLNAAQAELMDRYEGALLGLAIGDALGARGETGIWASDTAMTCCLAASLIEAGGHDPENQMQHYLRWLRQGEYSAAGQAHDAPKEVQRAVATWQWSGKPMAGSHDPANLDAHPLARTSAVALCYARTPLVALQEAAEAARTTLQSPIALDACRVFAALLVSATQSLEKKALIEAAQGQAFTLLRQQALKPQVAVLLDGGWRVMRAPGGVDIVSVLAQAWRAFAETNSFHAGMLSAIQTSPAAATVGAVYGALAGAHYGVHALPKDWREQVAQRPLLLKLVIGLFTQAAKQ